MNTPTVTHPIDALSAAVSIQTILTPDTARVFAVRAQRFRHLAETHSLADWLRQLARLTQLQHDAVATLAEQSLPDAGLLDQARRHGMPPLNAASLNRPAVWHDILHRLIDGLSDSALPAARERLAALRNTPPQRLESLASALLNGQPDPADLPDLPLVATALQTLWTAWAAQLGPAALAPLDPPGLCPCCGSLPVASIVRTAADTTQTNNLRYLHCSLCNTEWNMPRAVCTACGTDKDICYQQIDGSNGSVRAECCDTCHSYLKIVVQEKDTDVDPVADDLATLALDLLVDEASYSRSGPNLLLLGGAS